MNDIWIQAALAAPGDAPTEGAEGTKLTSEPGQVTGEEGTKVGASKETPVTETPRSQNPWSFPLMLGLMLVVMYLLLFMGPKKKQKEHNKMMQTLKRNDRVRTIGGIVGTVIDIHQDDITLKIDESNNTKIHVIPGAIATVLSDAAK